MYSRKEYELRRALNRMSLIVYSVALVYFVVLKGSLFYRIAFPYLLNSSSVGPVKSGNYNLIPFHTIKSSFSYTAFVLPGAGFLNLAGNILAFMPLGFLLPLVFIPMKNLRSVLLATILVSLSAELFQLVTGSGFCDIDDLLLNTIGGLTGYGFFAFIYR